MFRQIPFNVVYKVFPLVRLVSSCFCESLVTSFSTKSRLRGIQEQTTWGILECCGNKISKIEELFNSKITLPEGKLLPHSLSLKDWTHDFTGIPDFRFTEDCAYKSLEGFRLTCRRSCGEFELPRFKRWRDRSTEWILQFPVQPLDRPTSEIPCRISRIRHFSVHHP